MDNTQGTGTAEPVVTVDRPPATVTIRLSEREAFALRYLLGRLGGNTPTYELYCALSDALEEGLGDDMYHEFALTVHNEEYASRVRFWDKARTNEWRWGEIQGQRI